MLNFKFLPLNAMDITQMYAITAGAIFALVLMMKAASSFLRLFRPYSVLLVKHPLPPSFAPPSLPRAVDPSSRVLAPSLLGRQYIL